jgi:hypothetical protein
MNYHARTLAAMRKPRAVVQGQSVAATEMRLATRFPTSVRQWYEEINGRELLAKYSNEDRAIDPRDFRIVTVGDRAVVPVLVENQDVCWWGFELDGSDDPPVYVNFDPLPNVLFAYSSTFSEFTYVRIFDFDGWRDQERSLIEITEPVQDATMEWLANTFTREPRSLGWPASMTYRFSCQLGRIVIWQSEQQADWVLSARSARALSQLKELVDHAW